MKHISGIIAVLGIAAAPVTAFADDRIPVAESVGEVADLPASESIIHDEKRDIFYVSVMGAGEPGDGFLASVSADGKIVDRDFITGLNDPKGSVIIDDILYVSDRTELVAVNLDDKTITRYDAPGAMFLNDVAADDAGNIYISDTGQSAIYKFDTDAKMTLWVKSNQLNRPNGLMVEGDTVYVASWGEMQGEGDDAVSDGRLLRLDMASHEITPVTAGPIGNIDGIQRYNDGFLISEWRGGKVYHVTNGGGVREILAPGTSVGDILYLPQRKQLFLPMNRQAKLLVYSLSESD